MNPLMIPQIPLSSKRFPTSLVVTGEWFFTSVASDVDVKTLHCVETLPTAIHVAFVSSLIPKGCNKTNDSIQLLLKEHNKAL